MSEMREANVEFLRKLVRSLYDAQKLRIQTGNRVSAQERAEVLDEEWEGRARRHADALELLEREMLKDIKAACKTIDVWPWLEGVKGCGPAMSGVIISEIQDPARFETVSRLWAYCGLHVIDGAAPRRKKGEKANWNGFLKTKLLGVLGPSFLKCTSPYRSFYDDYKNRCANRPCSVPAEKHREKTLLPNGCSAGHMHEKANRYMVKMFLSDLLVHWRTLRGLPVRPPYAEEYLGRVHHG